jgi:methylglutaconyl-CoA hydratase
MTDQSAVLVERDERGVVRVTLNRDAARNALSPSMIDELRGVVDELAVSDARIVVFTGAGRAFSAGADIDALAEVANFSLERNVEDSLVNDALFRAVNELPMPVVARVNGAAVGGGAALLACADIVVAADSARIGFGEVRVGIVPAVISTFVIPKIGVTAARQLMLTGQLIDAARAQQVGLVHEIAPLDDLDDAVDAVIAELLAAYPAAQGEIKRLITTWPGRDVEEYRAEAIEVAARVRFSDEGRLGLTRFVESARARVLGDVRQERRVDR